MTDCSKLYDWVNWKRHYQMAQDQLTEFHFPCWSIHVKWTEIGKDGKREPNSICPIVMQPHAHADRAALEPIAWELWQHQVARQLTRHRKPVLEGFGIRFRGWWLWCVDWFNHFTYPAGRTDAQLLDAMEQHVYEMQAANEWRWDWRVGENPPYYDRDSQLMGANDRYRWSDVCRCVHCQARGIVRISH